jgi:hypothetical protein
VIETRQPPEHLESRSHVLLDRLSSHLRSLPNTGIDEISEPPQPRMSSRLRPQVLLGHLSSPLPRSQLYADEATESQRSQMPSGSRPGTLISHLSSLFRSPPNIDEAIEHQHCPGSTTSSHLNPHVVDVAVMRDREVCFSCMCCNCWVQRFLCRSYLLLIGPTLLVIMKWPSASKTPNRGFT